MKKKYITCIISIIAFVAYLLNHNGTQKSISTLIPSAAVGNKQSIVRVIEVIDGDTIVIDGGKKLRYIGIDTPETKHPTKGVQCFGKEAFEKNNELVKNKFVVLEKDISEIDRYGRLLRYVWLADSQSGSKSALFVNDYLVRQGYASVATFPPDVKYSEQFREAELEARTNIRGLWSRCN